jgi:aspartate/methionine/tyrosine aminotransferase
LLPGLRRLGFKVPVEPSGAFYLYADISGLSDDSFRFAAELIEEAGVAATPGIDFGRAAPQRHMRFAYTVPEENLREGLARIERFLARGR